MRVRAPSASPSPYTRAGWVNLYIWRTCIGQKIVDPQSSTIIIGMSFGLSVLELRLLVGAIFLKNVYLQDSKPSSFVVHLFLCLAIGCLWRSGNLLWFIESDVSWHHHLGMFPVGSFKAFHITVLWLVWLEPDLNSSDGSKTWCAL